MAFRPNRYNVWGMDYRPYNESGPSAERSGAAVPQYPQQGQKVDYGPPPSATSFNPFIQRRVFLIASQTETIQCLGHGI